MSSVYLFGYAVFTLIVLTGVNGLMRRNSKKRKQQDQAPISNKIDQDLLNDVLQKKAPSLMPSDENKNGVSDLKEAAERTDSWGKVEIPSRLETHRKQEPSSELVSSAQADTSPSEPNAPEKAQMKREAAVNRPADGAEQSSDEEKEIKVGKLVAAMIIGAFVTILNQTLINVALPQMMSDLNVTASTIQWLITGFMLMNGVLIPITAFLIARFGTRKLFIAAIIFFTIGALICALAPSFAILLTGRLVQAIGAGIIMPLMMTVFLTVFPPEKRGAAMGAMGIPMMFAPALGPTLSGWIVEHYNWRLLFYIVIPFSLLDLVLAFAWIRNVTKITKPKFDVWGAIFSTFGFGGLLYGFSEAGNKGWGSAEVVLSLFIGTVALVLFVWRELSVDTPMLELRVFKYDVFTLTTIISSVLNMAMFAAMILLPIYLQNIRGFTPIQSGLLLLPGAIITAIMQPIAGAIFDKIGARLLAIIGLSITVITTWEFSRLTGETTYDHILWLYIMRMFGMSFLMMTVMTAGLNQLPRSLNAHGTAMANTMRQVAASLGTAFLVTVMTNRANFHMASFSDVVSSTNPIMTEQLSGVGQGLAAASGVPAAAGTTIAQQLMYGMAMKQSMIEGINDSFLVATGIAAVALLLSFFIKRVKPNLE